MHSYRRHADTSNMGFLIDILGGLLLLAGLYVIGCSYVRQAKNFRNRNRADFSSSSPTPFVGPILVVIGLSLLQGSFSAWCLLAFVLDPDTVVVVYGLPGLFKMFFRRS